MLKACCVVMSDQWETNTIKYYSNISLLYLYILMPYMTFYLIYLFYCKKPENSSLYIFSLFTLTYNIYSQLEMNEYEWK